MFVVSAAGLWGQPATGTVIVYTYDPLYRLTKADYSDGSYFEYTYDEVGNRLTQTACVTSSGCTPQETEYEYDDGNRLIEVDSVAYTWDDNGNLLDDGTHTYAYRCMGTSRGKWW